VKRYLITGATGGLGAAIGDALRGYGSLLEFVGRGDADFMNCASVTSAVKFAVHRQFPDANDVARVPLFEGIVHCAGVELVQPLRLTSDDQYRAAMMAADSAFAILRAAAPRGVMADGGSIVLMSSVAAHRGTPGMAAYSAGKAAIEAMARCAAIELAPRGIRVNCVAAGAFESPMHARVTGRMPETARAAYAAKHPLGFGTAEAVRDAVLYLLSDASRWTTGTTMVVDGGFLAG